MVYFVIVFKQTNDVPIKYYFDKSRILYPEYLVWTDLHGLFLSQIWRCGGSGGGYYPRENCIIYSVQKVSFGVLLVKENIRPEVDFCDEFHCDESNLRNVRIG